MRPILVLVAAAACLSLASPARGDNSSARKKFEQAKRAYNIGHYPDALEKFEHLYEDTGDPALLYNIGQCHRLLNHNEDAAKAYRAFLREFPAAPNRRAIEAQIRELEEKIARESKGNDITQAKPESPPPTPPPTADTSPRPVPAPEVVSNRAAVPQPEAAIASRPAGLLEQPAPPRTESDPVYTRWWFWTGIGAVLVAGTITAIALSRSDSQSEIRGTMEPGVVSIP